MLTFLRQTLSLENKIQCCSYSVVTIHGAYIVSFNVESVVLLHLLLLLLLLLLYLREA